MDLRSLWDFSDPDASRDRFVALRDEATTQIARTFSLTKKFAEAHATLDTLDEGALAPRPLVCYLLERGRTFNSAGTPDDARPLFVRAWDIASEHGLDGLAVDAAHMLGIIEPHEDAVAWNERAMALAESSEDESANRWLGALYHNLGWTYHAAGEFERALDLFERGVDWRSQQDAVEPRRIAKWTVGRALRSLERYDEALEIQHDLEAERDAVNEPGGFVFEELGELYLQRGDDRASGYFARALPLLRDLGWVDEDRLQRIKELAES